MASVNRLLRQFYLSTGLSPKNPHLSLPKVEGLGVSARRSLTATQVSAIKEDGVHWVAPSLYMQVRTGQGTRSWLFRYSRNDTNQWMGLGSTEEKPFTEAREEAAMLRVLVKRGEDPIAQKREVEAKRQVEEKAKAPSFDECAKQYVASHESGWKNDKHIAQWKSTLKSYCGPVIGKLRVDEITVEDVPKVLKPIWVEKPETASRLRGRIEKVLGWATAMKYREGENPAAWTGALQHLLPATSSIPEGRTPQGRPICRGTAGDGRSAQIGGRRRQGTHVHDLDRLTHR